MVRYFVDPDSALPLNPTIRRHLRRLHRLPRILPRRIPNSFQELKSTQRWRWKKIP
jgi:hypothetical protein